MNDGKQIRCPRCGRLFFKRVAGSAKIEIVCRSSTCKGQKHIVSV